MSDTTAEFKQQLPRNLILQILSFFVHVGLGLWLVPYLVTHLGRGAYGLIPIAGMMTQYVSLISQNVSSSVTRFLTIALQRNDWEDVNRVFNTAFFSYLAIIVVQIPLFILIIYYADAIITIPEGLYRDAVLLLACSATGFLINLIGSVFGVPIYARNRLDISRGIDIVRQASRIVGIVGLFLVFRPSLRYVGYVDLAVSAVSCAITIGVGKRLAPALKLNVRAYDWHKVRQLVAMGGWLTFNYLGFLLFLRIDIWVCNRFVGAEVAGDYAAVLQWSNLIRQGGAVISAVIAPMIMIYYARGEMGRLIRLSQMSVRFFSLVLAIPISILCTFSPLLLNLWLGESFVRLAPLMVIMLCHLVANLGALPLFNIQVAMNKVRWPGIVTLLMGVVNVFLAIFFVTSLGWGIYGVAIAGAVVLTAKNALFTPIYAAAILHRPWHTFIRSYVSGVIFLSALLAGAHLVNRCVQPASWVQLILASLAIAGAGLCAVWLLLSKADRRLIIDLAPSRFRGLLARFVPI